MYSLSMKNIKLIPAIFYVFPCGGGLEHLHRGPATKREPGAWGHNWVTLSLGDINAET
jgi:hypothetical protein